MASASYLFVMAVLFSAAHLGAAHISKDLQLGRHMLQYGFNGAAFARPANSRCLVGPNCGGGDRNREREGESSSSPSPDPRGGRHLLSQISVAGISGVAYTENDAIVGRHILQNGVNGAAYVRPKKSQSSRGRSNERDPSNQRDSERRNGRNLLHKLTGLH